MALPYPIVVDHDAPSAPPPIRPLRQIRQPGAYRYALGSEAAPIARVAPGETVVIHTIDRFGDWLGSEAQSPSASPWPHLNPVTGPIFVEGAEPGDTLVVTIAAIDAARDWAVSCLLPGHGGLTAGPLSLTLPAPLSERVWLYRRTASGGFAWRGRWEVPWAPFFGTIGVAPAVETISSETPGAHGGNLDVPEVGPGNRLFLPVHHPGALCFVGDAHAAQGQGGLGGPALEIAARGTLTFDVVKGRAIAWPRIESVGEIMTVGCGRPMEDAVRIAYHELVRWLEREHGFDPLDAYQLLTQVGGLRVANMVNSASSVVASCPKRYLDGGHGGSGGPLLRSVHAGPATPDLVPAAGAAWRLRHPSAW